MSQTSFIGQDAILAKGHWKSFKWLLLRRSVQIGVLFLFLLGPLADVWVIKGNIASSLTLGVLPLSDPFVLLQSILSGTWPENTALLGAGIIISVYFLIGGRVYCAWVCPINIVTDTAAFIRRRLPLPVPKEFSRNTRYLLLAASLLVSLFGGVMVWELLNPVTLLYRGLLFGLWISASIVVAIFLFDVFISRRGWCGRLCPMGAFYSLLGQWSPVRIRTDRREQCNDCLDCYAVCPEPHVITPALKDKTSTYGYVIRDINCNNCGRCIDICSKEVFQFGMRFSKQKSNMRQPENSEV